MNNFDQYVQKSRDCHPRALDAAVLAGLGKARDNRLDPRKFVRLGLAFALAAAAIFTVSTTPLQEAIAHSFANRNHPLRREINVNTYRSFVHDINGGVFWLA